MFRTIASHIDRWHWLLLALAAPFLLFPAPARSPVLLIVPLLSLIAWIARPRAPCASCAPLPVTPLNAPLLLLMFMVLVSVVITPDLTYSLPKVAGVLLGCGVFLAVARESSRPAGFRFALLVLLALGLGIATVALVGTSWNVKLVFLEPLTARLGPRLTGLTGAEEGLGPNQVAGSLIWVVPIFICLAFAPSLAMRRGVQRRWLRVVLIVMSCLAALGVLGVFVLTQSRSGYIGLALAFGAIIFLSLSHQVRWVTSILLAVVLLVTTITLWPNRNRVIEQLWQSTTAISASSNSGSLETLNGRLEIWSRAIYGIEDFPFTGMGMNSFRRVVHLLYPLFLSSPDTDIAHAHNEFLQAALDLGIPGMIAFGSLYIVALWMLRRIWISPNCDRSTRAIVLGLGGGLFGHLIYGMTDAVALGAKPGILFWILLGLISGLFAQYGNTAIGRISGTSVDGTVTPAPQPAIPSAVAQP